MNFDVLFMFKACFMCVLSIESMADKNGEDLWVSLHHLKGAGKNENKKQNLHLKKVVVQKTSRKEKKK